MSATQETEATTLGLGLGGAAGASDLWDKGLRATPDKSQRNKLNARTPHPVQGCPCEPYIHTRPQVPTEYIQVAWYRSRVFRHCAYAGCRRSGIELEAAPKLQCMGCLQAGLPDEFSNFCSADCLKQGFPAFANAQYSLQLDGDKRQSTAPSSSSAATGSDDTKEAMLSCLHKYPPKVFSEGKPQRSTLPSKVVSKAPPPTAAGASDDWCLVSCGSTYTPTVQDVWHKLLMVVVVDWSHGASSAQLETKRVTTEWVVPSPPPHPPRPLTFKPCTAAGATPEVIAATQALQAGIVPAGRLEWLRQAAQTPKDAAPAPPPRVSPAVVRVASYNTLAEIYATRTQYPYAPIWVLSWEYRRLLVVAELRRLDADILCLQEVQADHYDGFLCPALRSLGYAGLYKQKTRDSMGKAGKVDGCALFFKEARFALQAKHVIEFNDAANQVTGNGSRGSDGTGSSTSGGMPGTPIQLGRPGATISISSPSPEEPNAGATSGAYAQNSKQALLAAASGSSRPALQRLLRDNVAQLVLLRQMKDANGKALRPGEPGSRLLLCNTHLFWDPEYADVKLWQAHMLVRELEQFVAKERVPVILCGDFNSEPHTSVTKLLGRNAILGKVHSTLLPEDMPSDPAHILPGRDVLSHGLMLQSAYASVMGRDPAFTNFTEGYKGTLDYVYFSSDQLAAVAVLNVPSDKALQEYSNKPLPNEQWPSDHLCLCADFVPLPPSAVRDAQETSQPSARVPGGLQFLAAGGGRGGDSSSFDVMSAARQLPMTSSGGSAGAFAMQHTSAGMTAPMAFGAASSGLPGSGMLVSTGASSGMSSAPGMLMLGGNRSGASSANMGQRSLPGAGGQGGNMNQMMPGGGMSGPMSGIMGPGGMMRGGGNWNAGGGPPTMGQPRSSGTGGHMLPGASMFQDTSGSWAPNQGHMGIPGSSGFAASSSSGYGAGGGAGRMMGSGNPGMR